MSLRDGILMDSDFDDSSNNFRERRRGITDAT
jgi:hypothetical protein